MTAGEKIKVLLDERRNLRSEIVSIEQTINRCLFTGMAAFAVFVGIYWKEDLAGLPTARMWILFLISQAEYVLMIFVIMLWGTICGYSDYIAALERKINNLADERLSVWESEVATTLVWHPKAPTFWSAAVLYTSLLVVFLGSLVLATIETEGVIFHCLGIFEMGVTLFLFAWTWGHRSKARMVCESLLVSPL